MATGTDLRPKDLEEPYIRMYYQLPRGRSAEMENRDLSEQYAEDIADEIINNFGTGMVKRHDRVSVGAGAGWLFPVAIEVSSPSIQMREVDRLHDIVNSAVDEHIGGAEQVAPYSDADYDEVEIRVGR